MEHKPSRTLDALIRDAEQLTAPAPASPSLWDWLPQGWGRALLVVLGISLLTGSAVALKLAAWLLIPPLVIAGIGLWLCLPGLILGSR